MIRNTASQKVQLFAYDYSTGAPKTGDAANLTAYVKKDSGALTVLGDTSATEISSTNAPGWYEFDLTQGETDAVDLVFTGKSATANVVLVGFRTTTVAPNFALTGINSSGHLSRVVLTDTTTDLTNKGTGSGFTAIPWNSAWDAEVQSECADALTAYGASTLTQTQVTGGAYALNSASFAFNAALDFTTTQKAATLARVTLTDTVTTYTGNTPQTGDSFARLTGTGAVTFASLTVSGATTLTGNLSLAAGLTITQSTTNGNGIIVTGNGTGSGVRIVGGATGNGLTLVKGASGSYDLRSDSDWFWAGGTLTATAVDSLSNFVADYGSGTLVTNISGTVTTVTTLTNLPAITANWLTSTGIANDAITAAKIANGAIDRATFAADTGLQTVRSGTAQSGDADTITLDASASAIDGFYYQRRIYLTGGTGAGQDALITDYNGTTKTATIAGGWWTEPDNTTTFAILPDATVNVGVWAGSTPVSVSGDGYPIAHTISLANNSITSGVIAASAIGSSEAPLLANLDATVSSRAPSATALSTAVWTAPPTGFLAATFPATVASTTNITAGTITTATNVTTVNGLAANVITSAACADGFITDAKITFPSESAGRPTTFLAAMRRAWEWCTNKRTRNRSTGALTLRNAADTADLETQTQSTAGSTDTVTKGV